MRVDKVIACTLCGKSIYRAIEKFLTTEGKIVASTVARIGFIIGCAVFFVRTVENLSKIVRAYAVFRTSGTTHQICFFLIFLQLQ